MKNKLLSLGCLVPMLALLAPVITGANASITHFQQTCDDGSKTDFNGMCHYAICPDGSTPVGSGICVGQGIGECIHAADANGNCMGPTFCGGPPDSNGYCPVTPPRNTSISLPQLHCDRPGYVSCYDFGREAGGAMDPHSICPIVQNSNQTDNYCMGFMAGQEDQLPEQTPSQSLPHVVPPVHIRTLVINQTTTLPSQGYKELRFSIPPNITNVYFSLAAEVVGNNFTGVNTALFDITECHKTVTLTQLQPYGQCGISILDSIRGAATLDQGSGSIDHLRLLAGRSYLLLLKQSTTTDRTAPGCLTGDLACIKPADEPVLLTAYFTYIHSSVGDTVKIPRDGTAVAGTKIAQHNTQPTIHVRVLDANQTTTLSSHGSIEVKFSIPPNITNVYFSLAAEVVGNNFTGIPGVDNKLYDVTECHKPITSAQLQPDGQCGISYFDDSGLSAMNGSFGGERLPNDRNYILILTNPADGPVQVEHSANFTYSIQAH